MNGTAGGELDGYTKHTVSTRQILALLFTLAIGCLLGGYATSSLLESEYQAILSQARANYQLSLSETKEGHKTCHQELAEQKKSYLDAVVGNDSGCTDELKLLKSQWRHEELSCQQEVEREMLWSHKALEDSTSALTRASAKLQSMKDEIAVARAELGSKHAELEHATTNLKSTRVQQQETQQQLDQIKGQWDNARSEFEQTQTHLSTLEEEMERRDMERAACDKTHRDLDSCQNTLQKTLEGGSDGYTASLDLLQNDKAALTRQLEILNAQNYKVVEESEFMKRRSDHVEKQLESANELVKEFEIERDRLKGDFDSISEKMRQRDRLSVLNR